MVDDDRATDERNPHAQDDQGEQDQSEQARRFFADQLRAVAARVREGVNTPARARTHGERLNRARRVVDPWHKDVRRRLGPRRFVRCALAFGRGFPRS